MTTETERYATERLEAMTKSIAGCLKPITIKAILDDIDFHGMAPLPEDVATFGNRLAAQLSTLE